MTWKAKNKTCDDLEEGLQDVLEIVSPGRIIGFAYDTKNKNWHIGYWLTDEEVGG